MLDVLLVEDEPSLRDIGKCYLERREEFRIDTAEDGEIALGMLEARPYHVIVSDYDMPNMNGIELLREVKHHLPRQPFIIFTGKGREEVVIDALNLGADFYLQKGGEIKAQYTELAHKCRWAVERRTAQDQIAHLARLYSFLSSVNKCVYSHRKKDDYIKDIVQIAVHEGGFCQTIITLNHPVQGSPEVVATGRGDGYSLLNDPVGRPEYSPTGNALQSGRYHICSDHRTYPHTKEVLDLYIREGILASAAFPIHIGEKIIGAITFHSSEPGFFNEEETLLLYEITETLSVGFELIERDYKQGKLRDYLNIAWHAIDASGTPILLLNSSGTVVYGNTALALRSGIRIEDITGTDACMSRIFSHEEWKKIRGCSGSDSRITRGEKEGEVLSVRAFTYQDQAYFWVRIEREYSEQSS